VNIVGILFGVGGIAIGAWVLLWAWKKFRSGQKTIVGLVVGVGGLVVGVWLLFWGLRTVKKDA
jgi:hypothetical protein